MACHQLEQRKEVVEAHKLKMEGLKTDVLAHKVQNDQCRLATTQLTWQTHKVSNCVSKLTEVLVS